MRPSFIRCDSNTGNGLKFEYIIWLIYHMTSVIQGDITAMKTGAIVNAANFHLSGRWIHPMAVNLSFQYAHVYHDAAMMCRRYIR